jgi:hypothetical protein
MRIVSCFCLFFLVCSMAVCCVGCGGGAGRGSGFMVGGKVAYADGQSVNNGQVTFTSRTSTFSGDIMGGGSYSIMGRVPAGTYKVAVIPLLDTPLVKASPVDTKYSNPDTSGIVCEVKGQTAFNFTVEAPQ